MPQILSYHVSPKPPGRNCSYSILPLDIRISKANRQVISEDTQGHAPTTSLTPSNLWLIENGLESH